MMLDVVEKVCVCVYVEVMKFKGIRIGSASLGSGERLFAIDVIIGVVIYWIFFVYLEFM